MLLWWIYLWQVFEIENLNSKQSSCCGLWWIPCNALTLVLWSNRDNCIFMENAMNDNYCIKPSWIMPWMITNCFWEVVKAILNISLQDKAQCTHPILNYAHFKAHSYIWEILKYIWEWRNPCIKSSPELSLMRKCLHSQNTFGNGHKSLSSLNQFVFVFFGQVMYALWICSLNVFVFVFVCPTKQQRDKVTYWAVSGQLKTEETQKDPHTGKVQFETLSLSLTLSAVGKVKPKMLYARMKMRQIRGRILFPNTLQRWWWKMLTI